MAYYGINELTQSGATASLVQAGGFARSTVFGTSPAHTHQFSGSVYISGNLRAWTYKVDEVVSGSTIFGNDASDTHQITGSLLVTDTLANLYVGSMDGAAPTPGVITLKDSGSTGQLWLGSDGMADTPGQLTFVGSGFDFLCATGGISLIDAGPFTALSIDADSAPVYMNGSSIDISGYGGVVLADNAGTIAMANGGTAVGSFPTASANITFEVHYTGSKDPVAEGTPGGGLASDTGGGEVVYYGITALATTQGYLHYLNDSGKWELANANATGSTGETGAGNAGLLAIALGTDPQVDGMLTRGYYNLPAGAGSVLVGTWVTGSAVYVYSGSAGDAGKYTCEAPEAPDSYTRIVGYCTTRSQVVYFNPGSSWIENGP